MMTTPANQIDVIQNVRDTIQSFTKQLINPKTMKLNNY